MDSQYKTVCFLSGSRKFIIQNKTEKYYTYKVKITSPKDYRVIPTLEFIEKCGKAAIEISPKTEVSDEGVKIMIIAMPISVPMSPSDLRTHWKKTESGGVDFYFNTKGFQIWKYLLKKGSDDLNSDIVMTIEKEKTDAPVTMNPIPDEKSNFYNFVVCILIGMILGFLLKFLSQ